MSTVTRKIKNVVKQYTFTEVKVREATSNDAWGPTSKQLEEVTELSHHNVAIVEMLGIIWKRLSERGKNWRHVHKSLIVLDHLIKCGSEKVVQHAHEKVELLRSLSNYDFYEENEDVGALVRDKSKQIVTLLTDQDRLKNERTKMLNSRKIYAQNTLLEKGVGLPNSQGKNASRKKMKNLGSLPVSPVLSSSSPGDDDYQLQLALRMSKEEHEEEERRRNLEEIGFQAALEESRAVRDSSKSEAASPLDSLKHMNQTLEPLERRLTLLSIATQHSDKINSVNETIETKHHNCFHNGEDDFEKKSTECYDPWGDLALIFGSNETPPANSAWNTFNQKSNEDWSFCLSDVNGVSPLDQKIETQRPSSPSDFIGNQKAGPDQGLAASFSFKQSDPSNVQPQLMFSPTNPFYSAFVQQSLPASNILDASTFFEKSNYTHAMPNSSQFISCGNNIKNEFPISEPFNSSNENFNESKFPISFGTGTSTEQQRTNPFL